MRKDSEEYSRLLQAELQRRYLNAPSDTSDNVGGFDYRIVRMHNDDYVLQQKLRPLTRCSTSSLPKWEELFRSSTLKEVQLYRCKVDSGYHPDMNKIKEVLEE